MYRSIIHDYIITHKEEMLEDAIRLMRINSVKGEEKDEMPFGEGPAKVLKEAEELLVSYGFSVTNHDNYVITADLYGKQPKLDILAHLDVVPAGDDWKITNPFEPIVSDGKLYGRGAADDKGPAIAAIYAMRAVKELDIPIESGVRLILGSDEESGSNDIAYFYRENKPSAMTISPDADYPVVNIEKGILVGEFSAEYPEKKELPYIRAIDAGIRFNVIPEKAYAEVVGLSKEEVTSFAKTAEQVTGICFMITKKEEVTCIEAVGVSAHGSEPDKAKNALTGLIFLLVSLPLSNAKVNQYVRHLERFFPHGRYDGNAIGIASKDNESVKTTISFDVLHMDETKLRGYFDCRTSLMANEENTTRVVQKKLCDHGFIPGKMSIYPPHHVPANSELVATLLDSYKKYTGREESPIATGGGTYVHSVPNGVAFGCATKEVDNHMHGADEFMEIQQMILSAELYADVIIKLCGKK